jgi:YVTN family beta-propeller protein
VRGDGAVAEMKLPTQEFSETPAHAELPNRIPPAAWPTSPDGSKVFLGHNSDYNKPFDNRFYLDYGRPPNVRPSDSMAQEFRIFDTHTWRKIGTIRTRMPCWSAAISSDGKRLYVMSPQKHSILVIDTTSKHVIRTLKVDGSPALALVAP